MTLAYQLRIELRDFKPLIYRDVPRLLRLIQSIPSLKAEPFKRWLAKVGHERISGVEKADKFALLTNSIYQKWTGLSVQAHK
jgi:hypothetical protein